MMNGIAGSEDFTRNVYISIFITPSVAKGGKISVLVPMASHVNHHERSTQIMISEHGLADLGAKTPRERAKLIIDTCVHPMCKDLLRDYVEHSQRVSFAQQTPHDLKQALAWHVRLQETGSMHPDLQQPTSKNTEKAAKKLDQTATTKQ